VIILDDQDDAEEEEANFAELQMNPTIFDFEQEEEPEEVEQHANAEKSSADDSVIYIDDDELEDSYHPAEVEQDELADFAEQPTDNISIEVSIEDELPEDIAEDDDDVVILN